MSKGHPHLQFGRETAQPILDDLWPLAHRVYSIQVNDRETVPPRLDHQLLLLVYKLHGDVLAFLVKGDVASRSRRVGPGLLGGRLHRVSDGVSQEEEDHSRFSDFNKVLRGR